MANIALSDLYAAAFGYIAKPGYNNIAGGAPASRADAWGKLDQALLRGETKEGLYGIPIAMPCKIGDVMLPNEPLVSVNLAKHIVETAIDGQDGTFKELYSLGDYQVTIQGLALNDEDPDNYPEEIVRELRRVCEERKHVAITCSLTTLFGITHVAIKGANFPALAGNLGVQPYEIAAASDREFSLKVRGK
ncbi:MAG: hypothetical protein JST98_06100 [Bacteroidetes bacterium]|nr:hypothetical protein [Bacteroidota bacterium]